MVRSMLDWCKCNVCILHTLLRNFVLIDMSEIILEKLVSKNGVKTSVVCESRLEKLFISWTRDPRGLVGIVGIGQYHTCVIELGKLVVNLSDWALGSVCSNLAAMSWIRKMDGSIMHLWRQPPHNPSEIQESSQNNMILIDPYDRLWNWNNGP